MMTSSISGIGGMSSPQLVSGASPYSSPTTKMTNLFQTIDSSGTGSITRQQFKQAFSTLSPPGRFQPLGANAIFSQLDPQGSGTVSKTNFVNGMTTIISSFGKTGTGEGTSTAEAAITSPSQSIAQSQQSLEQLAGLLTANSAPGSAVNKLV